jgi:CP family cyanate transporter-like MFS transporter
VGDRLGARKAAGIGAILIALGTLLRGISSDATSLLAYTFVYGVGMGWSFPNLPKLVIAWVPPDRAGMITGLLIAGQPLGMGLALATTMTFVFPLTNTFQGVFFFWSIPAILAAVLWWALVREPPHRQAHSAGSNTGGTSLRKVFKNRNLWLISTLILLAEFFFISFIGWAPTLLRLKGASADAAGLIASLAVWVIVPNLILMPRLAYKLRVRKPFIWVPSVILAGLSYAATRVPLSLSWLLMALAGIANSSRYGTIVALPIELMSEKEVGAASGLIMTFGFVGGAIGPYVGGHILDLTGSLEMSLLLLAGMSVATAIVALRLPETGRLASKSL